MMQKKQMGTKGNFAKPMKGMKGKSPMMQAPKGKGVGSRGVPKRTKRS